jgi:hypothetical protein
VAAAQISVGTGGLTSVAFHLVISASGSRSAGIENELNKYMCVPVGVFVVVQLGMGESDLTDNDRSCQDGSSFKGESRYLKHMECPLGEKLSLVTGTPASDV